MTASGTGCARDRQSPHIAPSEEGLVAIWSSSSRSKGWDVEWKRFGPRFDAFPPR